MTRPEKKSRVAFITFGCRANQYDTSAMMAGIDTDRFTLQDDMQDADIYVINTCTVTHKSDFQARQMIRRAKRNNPEARIVVTGCLVETNPESLQGLPYDHLVRPDSREKVAAIIMGEKESARKEQEFFFHPEGGLQHRTRALVKIQDGCDSRCAYCTVPLARGKSRSLEPEKVIHQLKSLFRQGFMEAVITGINLGSYGLDMGTSLFEILKTIDAEKDIAPRIRISSIEPHEISDDLIQLMGKSARICHHMHLPLQSGDDEILARMGRNYTSEKFSTLVQALHESMPDLCLGMDVIAGFPGESDKNFENTIKLLEEIPFAYLHVFPFSQRPGTRAERMDDKVASPVIKNRTKILRKMGQERRKNFYKSFEGKVLRALVEKHESGNIRGLSDNYIPVRAHGHPGLVRGLVRVHVDKAAVEGVTGTIEEDRLENEGQISKANAGA
jgi:threonylcarbamoyladenosine tRNA methylthiotransferase MtaB